MTFMATFKYPNLTYNNNKKIPKLFTNHKNSQTNKL